MTTQLNFKCWRDAEHELLEDDYYDMSPKNRMSATDYELERLFYKGIKIKVAGYTVKY